MHHNKQTGSALIIAILLLVGISVIGFAAINSSMLEERIAGNERNRVSAFNAAESALRNAENILNDRGGKSTMPNYSSKFQRQNEHGTFVSAVPSSRFSANAKFDVTSEELWASDEAIAWMIANGTEYGTDPGALSAPIGEIKTRQPRFFMEELTNPNRPWTYRITAVGWGDNDSVVVLQSYYTPRQNIVSQ
jgi:type IV pilus assembly protein PilX